MRKRTLRSLIAYSALSFVLLQSCKDDSSLTSKSPIPDQSFTESFDNFDEAISRGWRKINKSFPTGRIWYDVAEAPNFGSNNYVVKYGPDWDQAQYTLDSLQFPFAPFPQRYWANAFASQRATNGYAAISVASGDVLGAHDVSNWLVSPELTIQNGDKIVFYAQSKGLSRLQLWVNKTNSLNVGTGVNNTGDFTIKLVDINPTYANFATNPANAFPTEWTRFEGQVAGLVEPVQGRFGFRYFLQDQAPLVRSRIDPNDFDTIYTQIHRTVLGLDEISYQSSNK
ncbi:MAG: hypothetical protein RLY16_1036 [Bacteroidota bacterium]|jgi:hypothetical protein